jgi:hypothetical protein
LGQLKGALSVGKLIIEIDIFFIRKNTKFVIAVLSMMMIAAVLVGCSDKSKNDNEPTYASQEFDISDSSGNNSAQEIPLVVSTALPGFSEEEIQQLKDELATAHAALETANTDYAAELEARKADEKALEESQKKVAEFESEKNKLISELNAKEVELKLKTPPELDFKKIVGMYEGYGELVTLTYSYEVTVGAKTTGNIFTNKNYLYSIPGTLKVGVNFDKVKSGIVANDSKKTVTVTIPAAYFVSNEIDENNVQRYDISKAIFSKVEDKDYLDVAPQAKTKAEQQVINNGMLPYAQRLAGLEFIGLLEPVTSKSGYQIVVVYNK